MRKQAWIGLAILLIALPPLAAQHRPLPADPVTAEEREPAVRVATAYAQERALLPLAADRFALVGVELVALKPEDSEQPATPERSGRHAAMLFFDYDRNAGVRVLVDLHGGAAREAVAVKPGAVPIGRAEVERAVQLALARAEVQRLLGAAPESFRLGSSSADQQNTVEALRAIGASRNDPCTRNRCVDLLFRRGGQYVTGARVTVDLTARLVRVTPTER